MFVHFLSFCLKVYNFWLEISENGKLVVTEKVLCNKTRKKWLIYHNYKHNDTGSRKVVLPYK